MAIFFSIVHFQFHCKNHVNGGLWRFYQLNRRSVVVDRLFPNEICYYYKLIELWSWLARARLSADVMISQHACKLIFFASIISNALAIDSFDWLITKIWRKQWHNLTLKTHMTTRWCSKIKANWNALWSVHWPMHRLEVSMASSIAACTILVRLYSFQTNFAFVFTFSQWIRSL